jgi:hypothetical protein
MRFQSWMMVLLGVCALGGVVDHDWRLRIAWGGVWLLAALIGFRLPGARPGRIRARGGGATAMMWPRGARATALVVQCEQRIGRPVLAAARVRVRTPARARTVALALTGAPGVLWWLQTRSWGRGLGRVIAWRPLDGTVIHTRPRHRRRYDLELSRPAAFELLEATAFGPGADAVVGQLTAEEFRMSLAPTAAGSQGDG